MEALDAKAIALDKKFALTKNNQYLETAVRCYTLAFDVERKLMFNFSYDDSKLQMLKVSRSRSRKAIDLCYRLFQLNGNETWKEQAFQFAEKNKSFILLESIKRNIAANTGLKEDTLYQAVQLLQARLAHTDKLIFEAGAVKKDSLVLVYKTEKNKLANQLLLANNELTRSNSSFKELSGSEDSVSFSLVQKKLVADNTALIEFFTGDSSAYVFLVTAHSAPQFIKLTDSLSQSINDFLLFFSDKNNISNNPAAYQAAAFRLYQQTGLAGLQQTNPAKLIIIPDGRLGFVPFEALVTGISSLQNPAKFSYLLRRYDISYGYSVSTLLKQNENPSVSSGRLVCFAPAFTGNERGNATLVHSLEEAAAIEKENTGGEFYLKDKATLGQFRESIAGAGIIHIATHANAFTTGSTQPVIQLYDSSLYLNEIYTLHCNPRLVVLSACETGIGVLDQSEGALSLARGFYYAGAKNIITSLWSVDDESTSRIFKAFYSYSGNNYTTSLSMAKRNYLDNASVSEASPYYWAALIHLGCQQVPEKRNTTIPWLAAIVCLIVITLFLAFRRK
jgi:CHAT domain-containing protein